MYDTLRDIREIPLRKEFDIGCHVIRNPPTSKASKETSCSAPPSLLRLSLCIGSSWCLVSRSPVYLLVDRRRRLVLYVFLRVDKLDAIASLFAKNFLGKYAHVRRSCEPLNIEEVGHRDSPSLPFGQGL